MSTYNLGPLGNLNQVIVALGKTIRAMADGSIDSQTVARICNGLGIMRACLETQVLQNIEDKIEAAARRAIVSASAHMSIEDDDPMDPRLYSRPIRVATSLLRRHKRRALGSTSPS
jgi:hypothetical protein